MIDDDSLASVLNPKLDRVFGALGNRYRRLVLFMLWKKDGRIQASEVLIRGEVGASRDDQVDVRYVHLPKLEEIGYLEWDHETGEIVTGPNFEEVKPLLKILDDYEELSMEWF